MLPSTPRIAASRIGALSSPQASTFEPLGSADRTSRTDAYLKAPTWPPQSCDAGSRPPTERPCRSAQGACRTTSGTMPTRTEPMPNSRGLGCVYLRGCDGRCSASAHTQHVRQRDRRREQRPWQPPTTRRRRPVRPRVLARSKSQRVHAGVWALLGDAGLRFPFYGRISTVDHQDHGSSRHLATGCGGRPDRRARSLPLGLPAQYLRPGLRDSAAKAGSTAAPRPRAS